MAEVTVKSVHEMLCEFARNRPDIGVVRAMLDGMLEPASPFHRKRARSPSQLVCAFVIRGHFHVPMRDVAGNDSGGRHFHMYGHVRIPPFSTYRRCYRIEEMVIFSCSGSGGTPGAQGYLEGIAQRWHRILAETCAADLDL